MGTASEQDGPPTPATGGFPGGAPRLPRLGSAPKERGIKGTPDEPAVVFVTGGFVEDELTLARRNRRPQEATANADTSPEVDGDAPVYASFNDYSPNESLFFSAGPMFAGDDPTAETVEEGPLTPHEVLGLAPGATWTEIKAAHRALLAELHPDRFVTASSAEQLRASERLAAVNLAFHTLDRERRAS
jgi:DnaJ-domain-containing protein 1